MIKLYVEKLYRYPRLQEHLSVAVPFPKGKLSTMDGIRVLDGNKVLPVQCKVTARYGDGSVKYLFVRFIADLPGNQGKEFALYTKSEDLHLGSQEVEDSVEGITPISIEMFSEGGYRLTNGSLQFQVKDHSERIFHALHDGFQSYDAERFEGPLLEEREEGATFDAGLSEPYFLTIHEWSIIEEGPWCVILKAQGSHEGKNRKVPFEIRLTLYAGKPWIEVSYRIINFSDRILEIGALGFYCKAENDSIVTSVLDTEEQDSVLEKNAINQGIHTVEKYHVYRATGTGSLGDIERLAPVERVRTCTGYSNYKTDFTLGSDGECVVEMVTADRLMYESNEHYAEVFYGTLFADRTDHKGGICATIYQAQQNYPKAVKADREGLAVMLVPRGNDRVVMQPGMSREQRFLLHFHSSQESLAELDNRSLIYQMPDRPVVSPKVFRESGVMPEVFPDNMSEKTEIMLIGRADGHNRAFGMLNWGDSVDINYTNQGRGGGKPVWVNNEYDYPHACAMMYARTGTRRFLDYLLVSASHWQDVDICHYSNNPLWIGGQVEHTRGHVIDGKIVPSHEWVEGLLDYYHFTGDERGLESAIGIGENVLRLLETPMYARAGEMSARETGWALRTLTALYLETGEERWVNKSAWIVGQFQQWEKEYGYFLAPYTDNTLIRVGFMISVAVGSLMRYYRVFPDDDLKGMILRAIDDLVENCQMENGLFYYKELPSLARLGNNTLLLEAMVIGYELTGEKKYLEAGRRTFEKTMEESRSGGGTRVQIDDAVIWPGESTKGFGQSFLPLAMFDKACEEAGMR